MSTKESKENCAGDYPALWRIMYTFDQRIVRSVYGTGEVETVGMQKAQGQFDVIALTPALARAAFDANITSFNSTDVKEPEFICYVDASVHIGRYYGGRFS